VHLNKSSTTTSKFQWYSRFQTTVEKQHAEIGHQFDDAYLHGWTKYALKPRLTRD